MSPHCFRLKTSGLKGLLDLLKFEVETSLGVQWLRLRASTAGALRAHKLCGLFGKKM